LWRFFRHRPAACDASTDIFVALLQAALHDHLIPRYRRRGISHLVRRGEVGGDHIGAAVGVTDLGSDGFHLLGAACAMNEHLGAGLKSWRGRCREAPRRLSHCKEGRCRRYPIVRTPGHDHDTLRRD